MTNETDSRIASLLILILIYWMCDLKDFKI